MRNLNIQILSTFRSVKMHAGSNNGLTFFTFLTWNSAACLWGGGRWWWSSSRLRWSWGSAGIAAEGLTVTQQWPGRPLSEPWMLSFHPLRQWSGTDTHTIRGWQLFPSGGTPVFTFALASRLASASAAIARCSCWGNFTSLISTRSTLMPHASVASSKDSCKKNQIVPITGTKNAKQPRIKGFWEPLRSLQSHLHTLWYPLPVW